jgi:hypothetical protein
LTVTGGNADAPDWPAVCAFTGVTAISKQPSASALAVLLKVFLKK